MNLTGLLAGRKEFQPGTYTFPFSYTLPASLPGSFEDGDSSLVFSTNLIPRTLDDKKRSYIRYTASSFVEVVTKAADGTEKTANLGQAKDFTVAELFNRSDLISEPLVQTAKQEYIIGGHINCGVTVANGGVILSGNILHVRLDVDNQSRYPVDQITLTLNQITTFRAKLNEQPQEFKRTKQVLLVGVKGVDIKENQRFTKCVKLTPKQGHKWSPSVTLGEHIGVSYELVVNFFVIAENIEVKVPIRVCQYSLLNHDQVPEKIEADFGPELDFTPDWLAKLRSEADVPLPEGDPYGDENVETPAEGEAQ
eukprot:TRINITY_DN2958_c0_g1_i2.p1 TRINITY_DN2958_c0_g1~~TRINITY_DN2958_c0_g1_i2.p1  ORF type:complete len:309 (-),score=67.28 TRINITY_DN2958_c0_g1_i2:47-973(-)